MTERPSANVVSSQMAAHAGPPAPSASRPLWPHQRDAVNDAVGELKVADRATVVMACGTGKTRVAAETALRLAGARSGGFLYTAPNLELLSQTLAEWRTTFGHEPWGRIIAVCSDKDLDGKQAAELHAGRAAVTTQPAELAALAPKTGRFTILSTYHSLGVVGAAQRHHEMPMIDLLAIADEAHRTAGAVHKPWTAFHDDTRIRAARRLNLTATPRIVAGGDQVISMSDERVYGRTCHTLPFGRAIELGLLANYRVVVPVIATDQLREAARVLRGRSDFFRIGKTAMSPDALATQIAVLRAARTYGVQRMITFHNRVTHARWFATTLPLTADLLPPGERPEHVKAGHVHGGQTLAERRAVLKGLRSDGDEFCVVCNARVLGEGIDLEVDGIAFIDPRKSVIDTAQAVGRALRLGRRGAAKTATILIPVHLREGQDPETALESSQFGPVWEVVRALASHDEVLAGNLKDLRRRIGIYGNLRDPARRSELPEWLDVTGVPVPAGFAEAITVHLVRSSTTPWEEFLGACSAFYAEHNHLDVPPQYTTPGGLPLHEKLHHQRQRYRRGVLDPRRKEELEKFGIVWEVLDSKRQRFRDELIRFRREHGHLRIPKGFRTGGDNPMNLGSAVGTVRARYAAGKLSTEEIDFYESLGMIWRVTEADRAQFLEDLRQYKDQHGHLDIPVKCVLPGAPPRKLGQQVSILRSQFVRGELPPEMMTALKEIGFIENVYEFRYQRYLDALILFKEENGHVRLPPGYRTPPPGDLALYEWLQNRKSDYTKGKLPPERIRDLVDLGCEWHKGGMA
ncbi:DEAD/DEAH box helicase [Streptomyces sp. MMBL 11-1]|uniref:DEAD/DEAH box helicase n=1 Tax=Streptomyces sp. MMBL 11-1 TaxID=3026420 RepID=UPI00235EDCE5|nr:DEAD/DEAH box helicase [Streptomyces sp. MMBL 11-1]